MLQSRLSLILSNKSLNAGHYLLWIRYPELKPKKWDSKCYTTREYSTRERLPSKGFQKNLFHILWETKTPHFSLMGRRNVNIFGGEILCDVHNLPFLIKIGLMYLPKIVEDQSPRPYSFRRLRFIACSWTLSLYVIVT